MKGDMPLKVHLNELNEILMDLNIININKIEKDEEDLILLCSLPPPYDNVVNRCSKTMIQFLYKM